MAIQTSAFMWIDAFDNDVIPAMQARSPGRPRREEDVP